MTSKAYRCEEPTKEDVLAIKEYVAAKRNRNLSFVSLSELAQEK